MKNNISAKRQKSISFHVNCNDYFGTLATILDLSRQTLGNSARERKVIDLLKQSVSDLMHLQANYKIKQR